MTEQDTFQADLIRSLEDDARRYDARAAALESDARDFRRKATRARLAAGYVRKPTAPVGDGNG